MWYACEAQSDAYNLIAHDNPKQNKTKKSINK